jgi:hypothetical protein
MSKYRIKINFTHQTFKWSNEARGQAAVYCVIIGFALADRNAKKIYQYASVTSEPVEISAKQINAYLVDFDTLFITSRGKPLCNVPEMNFGNMPQMVENYCLPKKRNSFFWKKSPMQINILGILFLLMNF